MKKLLNNPDNFVDEMIEGILCAHNGKIKKAGTSLKELVRADAPQRNKVAIATGGGSGHLPVFLGYVGKGLCDGVAIGNVFASPSAQQMYNVTKAIDGGKGVLYIYGNYGGDIMNFDMAAEMAAGNGIPVETILVNDDVASAAKGSEKRRRGVAGLFYCYKIAGAKSDEGAGLAEVKRAAEKALNNTRTMGVALTSCTIPQAGKPTFEIAGDEMEIGMGIHGEPGIQRGKLKTADEIVTTVVDAIVRDLPFQSGDEVSVLVNGLGATPAEELYIVYRKVFSLLTDYGIKIYRPYIGEFATSLEMAGMSVTLMKLDDELKKLLDAPAASPFFTQI